MSICPRNIFKFCYRDYNKQMQALMIQTNNELRDMLIKKVVINPTYEGYDECFKWVVIAALYHEEIDYLERIVTQNRSYRGITGIMLNFLQHYMRYRYLNSKT